MSARRPEGVEVSSVLVQADAANRYTYPDCTLVRLVDADTFVARGYREMDAGFHIVVRAAWQQKFRLAGVACGAKGTPVGDEAARWVQAWLSEYPFTLTSLGPYKYGDEWMARVMFGGGQDLADLLVLRGLAVRWNGRGVQPVPVWPL